MDFLNQSVRPSLNSYLVALYCMNTVKDQLQEWADGYKAAGAGDFVEDIHVKAASALHTHAFNCAFTIVALHEKDVPVDDELYTILKSACSYRIGVHTSLVHQWVMRNKVRLPTNAQVGAKAHFLIGESSFNAPITDVIPREARVIVQMANGAHVSVNGEDITKITKGTVGRSTTTPTPPNNGGTPIAAVAAA